MYAKIGLVGLFDVDEAHIKGVSKHAAKKVFLDFPVCLASQAQPVQLFPKGDLAVFAAGIELECFLYEQASVWVNHFGLGGTSVKITERCRHWIKSLLEPSVKSLLHFLAQVPAVICRDHGLNISRKHATWRSQIKLLCCKMDFDASLYKLADFCPVLEISC